MYVLLIFSIQVIDACTTSPTLFRSIRFFQKRFLTDCLKFYIYAAFAALYLFHVFSSFLVHSIPTTGSSRSASLILFFSFQFQTFHFYALFAKYVILARKSPRSAFNLFLPVSIHRMVNLLEASQFNIPVSTISRNYLINIYNE